MFLELQKPLLVSFQQYWTQWWAIKQRYFEYTMAKVWKLQHSLFLSQWFPKTQSLEMAFISLHKTGRWTLLWLKGWKLNTISGIPQAFLTLCMAFFCSQKLSRFNPQALANETPHSSLESRHFLHSTTQKPGRLVTSGVAEHNGKGLKALAFTISEIPPPCFWKHVLLRKWLSFVPRAPEIPTSKFSGVLNTMVGNQAEILWILLNQTWQTNLLWPMIPQVPEQRWLAYHYTKLWQMNLLWLNTMAKVWKLQHSLFLRFPTAFPKTHFCLENGFLSFLGLQKPQLVSFWGCWTQWQRFESSSIHHFWDTPQHFLKTHFCLEIGFLLFLELQKSLLVSFQGYWTQWWAIKQRYFEYC